MNAKIWIYGIIRIFLSQQQPITQRVEQTRCCDLLENLYLCGSNNNKEKYTVREMML